VDFHLATGVDLRRATSGDIRSAIDTRHGKRGVPRAEACTESHHTRNRQVAGDIEVAIGADGPPNETPC
jgi:hypothetical protein